MKLDAMPLLAAKASGELASNVCFLLLTQKCIRNGFHKMSVAPQKKIITVNAVNIVIHSSGCKRLGGDFFRIVPLDLLKPAPLRWQSFSLTHS